MTRLRTLVCLLGLLMLLVTLVKTRAQELEPRALTNLPVGSNFVLAGYSFLTGNTLLDPALPVKDLEELVEVGWLSAQRIRHGSCPYLCRSALRIFVSSGASSSVPSIRARDSSFRLLA